MNFQQGPVLEILGEDSIKNIVGTAYDILDHVGVRVNNSEGLGILAEGGARVDFNKNTAWINGSMVDTALRTIPSTIDFYNDKKERSLTLGGENVYFTPASSALHILDSETRGMRSAVTADCINLVRVVDALEHIAFNNPVFILSDVPEMVKDIWRFFVTLLYTHKPIIASGFTMEWPRILKEMLVVMAGDEKEMREKPRMTSTCCISAPLCWDEITCQNLMDYAKYAIPVRVVAMPISGGNAPVTLSGTVLQHTAENLSGVVIHQLTNPGAPIYYGGSPSILDMRKGTTPMGAIETQMIEIACSQIGKYLGMATHAIIGLSDSKLVDAQAGLESANGLMLATLARINIISGPGMLDFESCQSLEKLVIDNDICGMAYRLIRGMDCDEGALAADIIEEVGHGGDFLSSPHTLQWLRKEHYFPSSVISRASRDEFQRRGSRDAYHTAKEMVKKILGEYEPTPFTEDKKKELVKIVTARAKKHGLDQLPHYALPPLRS